MFIHTYDEEGFLADEGWTVAAFSTGLTEEIKEWCYDTYGEPGVRWCDRISWGEVRFSDKKDLTLFLLRWS